MRKIKIAVMTVALLLLCSAAWANGALRSDYPIMTADYPPSELVVDFGVTDDPSWGDDIITIDCYAGPAPVERQLVGV